MCSLGYKKKRPEYYLLKPNSCTQKSYFVEVSRIVVDRQNQLIKLLIKIIFLALIKLQDLVYLNKLLETYCYN